MKNFQNNRLLEYLKEHRSIDPLRAWEILGIYRLSARIFDLRLQGHNITSTKLEIHNRFNEKIKVALYVYHGD